MSVPNSSAIGFSEEQIHALAAKTASAATEWGESQSDDYWRGFNDGCELAKPNKPASTKPGDIVYLPVMVMPTDSIAGRVPVCVSTTGDVITVAYEDLFNVSADSEGEGGHT